MSSTIDSEALKAVFAETLSVLDDISAYIQKALPQMKQTIEESRALADNGEKVIQKIEETK